MIILRTLFEKLNHLEKEIQNKGTKIKEKNKEKIDKDELKDWNKFKKSNYEHEKNIESIEEFGEFEKFKEIEEVEDKVIDGNSCVDNFESVDEAKVIDNFNYVKKIEEIQENISNDLQYLNSFDYDQI